MAAPSGSITYQAAPTPAAAGVPAGRVFLRLVRLLRPHWGMIGLGMLLLVASMPCELFPALVWKYVTDDPILTRRSRPTPVLPHLFSFGGHVHGKLALLLSSVCWLFVVYCFGEVLQSVSENVLGRVAQKFILELRNRVYHKLQCQSLGYLQRQRTGDLMSRALGDVDELQTLIVSGTDAVVGDGLRWLATVAIVMAMNW